MPSVRLSSSFRLILAMFNLAAGIEDGFGKAVVDILKKQYPGQKVEVNPSSVGHKLMAIAKKQNQGNEQRAMDAVQDFLSYIVGAGAGTVKEVEGQGGDTETKYTRGREWDFATDTADTWQAALDAIYANMRLRSMSKSMENSKRKKIERSIDDAYGKRGEDGGSPDGGEGRMPTPDENSLSKALDDQTAIKSFMDMMDDLIPDLRNHLSTDALKLFELIFDDEVGGFGSDIKDNMNQASALKEKYPDLYKKNEKRWSGFVGDLRKKLLDEIWDFIDNNMTSDEYQSLKDMFFSDTTPEEVRKIEKGKSQGKLDYQQGIDERKLSRLTWKKENESLDPKEEVSLKNLEKKLRDQGVDVDSIEPQEKPDDKSWKLHNKATPKAASSINHLLVAARLALL
jgi:hypothetical protein